MVIMAERSGSSNSNPLLSSPISVDHFPSSRTLHSQDHQNLYFLTHAHTDHTNGLTSAWSKPIYMTEVTKAVLIGRLKINPSIVKVLELNRPYHIELSNKESVCVTALDANHCPGAVMYLFEGYFGTVLHTGDFRYDPKMITDTVLREKDIDCIYMDGTYSHSNCNFPSRREATLEMISIIRNHKNFNVKIAVKSILGKESLFLELARLFQRPIAVSFQRMNIINILQNMNVLPTLSANGSAIFTCDYTKTNIHIIEWVEFTQLNVRYWNRQNQTIAIAATAVNRIGGGTTPACNNALPCYSSSNGIYYVPYSDHSSYNELCSFMQQLHPRHYVCMGRVSNFSTSFRKYLNLAGNKNCKKVSQNYFKETVSGVAVEKSDDISIVREAFGGCYMDVPGEAVKHRATRVSLVSRNQTPARKGVEYSSSTTSCSSSPMVTTHCTPTGEVQSVAESHAVESETNKRHAASEQMVQEKSASRDLPCDAPVSKAVKSKLSEILVLLSSPNLEETIAALSTVGHHGTVGNIRETMKKIIVEEECISSSNTNTDSTGVSSSSGTVLSPSSEELIRGNVMKLDLRSTTPSVHASVLEEIGNIMPKETRKPDVETAPRNLYDTENVQDKMSMGPVDILIEATQGFDVTAQANNANSPSTPDVETAPRNLYDTEKAQDKMSLGPFGILIEATQGFDVTTQADNANSPSTQKSFNELSQSLPKTAVHSGCHEKTKPARTLSHPLKVWHMRAFSM